MILKAKDKHKFYKAKYRIPAYGIGGNPKYKKVEAMGKGHAKMRMTEYLKEHEEETGHDWELCHIREYGDKIKIANDVLFNSEVEVVRK